MRRSVGLTYIEALGVAYFSGRRGWRVSFGTARRLSCYSAGAGSRAESSCSRFFLLQRTGWLYRVWPASITNINPYMDFLCLVVVGGLSISGFRVPGVVRRAVCEDYGSLVPAPRAKPSFMPSSDTEIWVPHRTVLGPVCMASKRLETSRKTHSTEYRAVWHQILLFK